MPKHLTPQSASVEARIPRDLYDAVQQYARTHRMTVSTFLREAIDMRLEVDITSRILQTTLEGSAADGPMSDEVRQYFAPLIDEIVRRVRQDDQPRSPVPVASVRHVRQEADAPPTDGAVSVRRVRQHAVPQQGDFDPAKFYLGEGLCPQGHNWQGTGRSLLRRRNQGCRECDNATKRARRAQRQAAPHSG